jgi:hypothetical protein
VTRFPTSHPEIWISNLKIFKFARASPICMQESNIFIHFYFSRTISESGTLIRHLKADHITKKPISSQTKYNLYSKYLIHIQDCHFILLSTHSLIEIFPLQLIRHHKLTCSETLYYFCHKIFIPRLVLKLATWWTPANAAITVMSIHPMNSM